MVRGLELQRLNATVTADLPTLRKLLSPQLVYCHSNARCETTASLLQRLQSHDLVYRQLQPIEVLAEPVGNTVIVRATVDFDATNGPATASGKLAYLAVYEHNPAGWQLRAYQSLRMP